jgi:hypothetical protein
LERVSWEKGNRRIVRDIDGSETEKYSITKTQGTPKVWRKYVGKIKFEHDGEYIRTGGSHHQVVREGSKPFGVVGVDPSRSQPVMAAGLFTGPNSSVSFSSSTEE